MSSVAAQPYDPRTTRRSPLGLFLASLRVAAWLGWEAESNWASAPVYALYVMLRPVTAALMLVVMYGVVSGGQLGGDRFAFVFLGQALFVFVTATMDGMGQALILDRERWQTLRYVFLTPAPPYAYLVGRGAARLATAAIGAAVTLAAGLAFLGLRLDAGRVDYSLALIGLALGLTATLAMGTCVAAITLVVARHSWSMGEAIGAGLHILCGAIFPIDVLPGALQVVSLALPLTYWLELERRALAGVSGGGVLGSLSTPQVGLALVGGTAALLAVTHLLYRTCERSARERGLIENTTGD